MQTLKPFPLSALLSLPPAPDAPARIEFATLLMDGKLDLTGAEAPPFLAEFEQLALQPIFAKPTLALDAPELAQRIATRLEAASDDIAAIMAAILLQSASFWPATGGLEAIPEWLINAYVVWRIIPPNAFSRLGEVEAYRRYLETTMHDFAAIYSQRTLPIKKNKALGDALFNNWNLIQLCFSESSNLECTRTKSVFLEQYLLRNFHALSWVFPQRTEGTKLRIGFHTVALHLSPEGCFFLSHVENFPRARCELVLFYESDITDEFQKFAVSLFDSTIRLSGNALEDVATIRGENLDVFLFANNLSSISNHLSFFASCRLARTQIALAASPMTTGYTASDIFVSSALSEAPGSLADRYSEEVYTLPGMLNYYAYQHDKSQQTIAFTRDSLGVADDTVLFLSIANYYKCIPELVDLWARILQQVPNGVLLVLPFGTAWGRYEIKPYVQNFVARFAEHGLSTDRLLIQPPLPARADVLALVKLADVYLDSYPFSGACSLLDPLLSHAPVVVREGATFRSRFAATMLRFIGLDDLVADSADAYEKAALRLARSAAERAEIRNRIQAALADGVPYFDTETLPRKLEAALVELSDAFQARMDRLHTLPVDDLKREIVKLSGHLTAENNHFWAELHHIELIRILALIAKGGSRKKAVHLNLPSLALTNLQQQEWDVTTLHDYSGVDAIDLVYFKAAPDEVSSLYKVLWKKPGLIIAELPDDAAATMIEDMRHEGYDCLIFAFARDPNAAFADIDNRPIAIHSSTPFTTADFTVLAFFPLGETQIPAQLLATLDRFRGGTNRSWTRLVPDGQRASVR